MICRWLVPCCLAACVAAAEEAPLPATVQRLIDGYERAHAKAVEEHDKTVADAGVRRDRTIADARTEAIKGLERELDRATKRGELDLALAIRSRIQELQPQQSADLLAAAAPAAADGKAAIASVTPQEAQALIARLDQLDWEGLRGAEIRVAATFGLINPLDTGIDLEKGVRLLLLPNPKDTWDLGGPDQVTNFRGNDLHWTPMQYKIGIENKAREPGIKLDGNFIAAGVGRLLIGCSDKGVEGNGGAIRVKVLRIVEAEGAPEKKDATAGQERDHGRDPGRGRGHGHGR